MTKNYFIGIDVSKQTLDAAFIIRTNESFSTPVWKQFDNTLAGLQKMKRWLLQLNVPLNQQTIVVVENTGIYHRLLWQFFSKQQIDLCIENAAQVKWSLGIARGKSDKVDIRRLALYAARHSDRLKPSPVLHQHVLALKDLITLRNKLLVQLKSIETAFNELKVVSPVSFIRTSKKLLTPAIKGLKQSLKKVEDQITTLIKKDDQLLHVYQLLISIPGVGPVTAIYLICCSNVFTMCTSGKQLACYCGVVPFDHQSGISIKGKHRVHKMANKELKKLLHMCALSAIQHYVEFKDYYNRKKQEGKHPMAILNAIRNKIVLRAFAVVKNDRPYVNNYEKAA
ncbi:IS110 family transposase [Panacibacter sp. DH6]|uniref:IS110 family transposase n=1 Tax=Panacibacter microcysteis TaxID=2793269 RepID=A0A931GZW3_9BACT|nr:IS110 family transposase [Panacibacter microcysteis]MBG9378418.1 IS110 family transposase [Panacibacter microcysteis]